MQKKENPLETRLVFSPKETQQMLNISSSEFYREIERGNLAIFKMGNRTRVTKSEVERWLSSKMGVTNG